jgi:bifunctional non-homologous end joining protein LigD
VRGEAAVSTGAGRIEALVADLDAIERDGGDGTVRVGGTSLRVSSLGKVYFPESSVTKGELLRYYARVSPVLLPLLRDRPLALQRFPNGIAGESFYQQRAPEHPPRGVRVAQVRTAEGELAPRVIGGSLVTLLWLVQIGVIAMHPWLTTVRRPRSLDQMVLDLDPGDAAPFQRVQDVARWTRDALGEAGARAAVKTSGSRGMHVVVAIPADTPEEEALRAAEDVARRVAASHPQAATVERRLAARPADAVYVDWLQNAVGKSVASAYSARPRPAATVSTPLRWKELDGRVDPLAFTVRTVPERVARLGDVWRAALHGRG